MSDVAMLTKLSARHREILRRTFLGESSTAIAQALGITARAVRKVRQAPEFREALEELHRRAEASLVDVPKRLELEQRLTEAAEKGVGVAEQIMLRPEGPSGYSLAERLRVSRPRWVQPGSGAGGCGGPEEPVPRDPGAPRRDRAPGGVGGGHLEGHAAAAGRPGGALVPAPLHLQS